MRISVTTYALAALAAGMISAPALAEGAVEAEPWRLSFGLPDEFGESADVESGFSITSGYGAVSLWATLQSERTLGSNDASVAAAPLDLRIGQLRDSAIGDLALSGVLIPEFDPNELILEGRIGALYRFGQGLSAPREGDDGGLYMFAGADAQALTWRFGGDSDTSSQSMRLEDLPMVGDAQAGLGWRLGAGDLSVGFIHREVRHASASAEEQFGGMSFVIRR